MAVPIHQLMRGQPALVTIGPDATLQDAVALMIEKDFSQLPVVEDGRPFGTPASFITSASIARALRVFGTTLTHLRVRDAMVPARTLSVDEDLFSTMDDLVDAYAVLVLNPDGTIAGIVTSYDTTQFFRHRAEDVLLVEDIETTLKDHIRAAFGGDEGDPEGPLQAAVNALGSPLDSVREQCRKAFRKFCHQRGLEIQEADVADTVDQNFASGKGGRTFDDLTLNDYIQLARRTESWAVLGPVFGVPDKAFLEMLEGVRGTRNKLMHFRPDVDAVERDRLRFCAEWFKNHPPIVPEDEPEHSALEPLIDAERASEPMAAEVGEYVEDAAVDGGPASEGASVESKYAPLAAHLSQQPRSRVRVALTFGEIERIIGAPLPAAAREHRSWWANHPTAHTPSEQWLAVSWRVASINMSIERVIFARARDRERAFIRFFSEVQRRLGEIPDFPEPPTGPIGMSWFALAPFRDHGLSLIVSFARGQRLRLECYIDAGATAENERIYGALLGQQGSIESTVGAALQWEPLENRRACRVALYTPGSISDDPERLNELVDWIVEYAPRFLRAIRKVMDRGALDAPTE